MNTVYLALGSNLGDKKSNIETATRKINEYIGRLVSVSSIYETAPMGFDSENMFANAACIVLSDLLPERVLYYTQLIEKEMGRMHKSQNKIYSDRIIDVDILMYNNEIINTPYLTLPHPHLHERNFVLDPLTEIAGSTIHPILNKTMLEMKEELNNNR